MAFANAGDVILQSTPLYGGTETLIRNVLPNYGVKSHDFVAGAPEAEIRQSLENAMKDGTVKAIYTETPTNPTNEVVDLELMKTLADELTKVCRELIAGDIETKVAVVPVPKASELCGGKPISLPPGHDGGDVRVVTVGGGVGCPCGGTHVKRTGEIGPGFQVTKLKNKKGNMRVSYKL